MQTCLPAYLTGVVVWSVVEGMRAVRLRVVLGFAALSLFVLALLAVQDDESPKAPPATDAPEFSEAHGRGATVPPLSAAPPPPTSTTAAPVHDDGDAALDVKVAVPLLLTSMDYHGVPLLATTLQGWVKHLFLPQKNMELLLFYDEAAIQLESLLSTLRLHAVPPPPPGATGPTARFVARAAPMHLARTPWAPVTEFSVHLLPTRLPLPAFLREMPEGRRRGILSGDNASWMRCGCPPYCPVKRATEGYVQGTRWYTHQLFLERDRLLQERYAYWVKLDVDIWLFKPLPFNIAAEMRRGRRGVWTDAEFVATDADGGGGAQDVPVTRVAGALIAHTGTQYNGHGCSDNLHRAIGEWFNASTPGVPRPRRPVAHAERWWRQDDNVYWSNFIVSSVAFHTSPRGPLALAAYLNEFENGFFRHRWTDQSLFHKVLGAFAGPNESTHVLDWSCLRWDKRRFKPHAVFYHSKQSKKGQLLKLRTSFDPTPYNGRSPCG